MKVADLAQRLMGDPQFARSVALAVCVIYAVSFFAFYPRTVTNDDESHYLGQAQLILEGKTSSTRIDALTGAEAEFTPAPYPLGNALSMSPFIAAFGWRGGFVPSFLSMLLGAWWLIRWLEKDGRSPLFVLLLFGYLPALIMARLCMSDIPSMAFAAGGLLLFWRGIGQPPGWWLAAGLVAGSSMLFRESNPLIFAPFFAGAVLRRDRNVWALVVGGLVGISLRLLSNDWFFGDAFFAKSTYQLMLEAVPDRLPLYLFAVLVTIPGGLVLALCYRGRRWPELCTTVAVFFTAYLIQRHWTFSTSTAKNFIVTGRYLLPLVPVMAFGMAESVPRLWKKLLDQQAPTARARLEFWGPRLVVLWAAGVTVATAAVHPTFSIWSDSQAEIRDALHRHVDRDAVLVSNYMALRKFLDADRKYLPLDINADEGVDMKRLMDRHDEFYVALLGRTDSGYWTNEMKGHQPLIDSLPAAELLYDEQLTSTDRLRIWRSLSLRTDPQ